MCLPLYNSSSVICTLPFLQCVSLDKWHTAQQEPSNWNPPHYQDKKMIKHSLSITLKWTTGFMVTCLSLNYSMCLRRCLDLCTIKCQTLIPHKMVGLHPLRDARPSCTKPGPCTPQSMREGLISRPTIQKWNSVRQLLQRWQRSSYTKISRRQKQ